MGKLFQVLTSPTATFEKIRDEKGAGWVLALILLTVVSLVTVQLSMPMLQQYTETTLRHALEQQGQAGNPNMLAIAKTTAVISAYVGAVLGVAMKMFLGGLLMLLVNLFVRGEAKYMQLAKVSLYSSVPAYISALLTSLIGRMVGATSPFDVAFNLGELFTVKHGLGFALATLINPFELYGLFLLVVGVSVVTRRPRKKVAGWIILYWFLVSFIGVFSFITQK